MQHITRLLMQARKATNNYDFVPAIGFVDYDTEKKLYTADPQDPEGATMPKWWRDAWETQQEATDALNRLFEGRGVPEKNRLIFIMDLGY